MSYGEIHNFIKESGRRLDLPEEIVEQIVEPQRIIEVNFPVKMDSGEIKIFRGFRVQHNNARGPYKGGLRFHPEINLEEVKVLAALMSLKTAVIDIPFGGGKGGVEVNPRELSSKELKRLTQGFARQLSDVIGERKDVPAPDVNTNAQVMKWFKEEYERTTGQMEPGVITGKSFADGGIKVRDEATGLGGAAVTAEIAKILGKKPDETTVAIQGFGNVGSHLAHHLSHIGFRIIAVADIDGGIMHEDGLDYHATYKHIKSGKKLAEICECNVHGSSTDCTHVGAREILTKEVDILIPAALGDQITAENASEVKAKIIVEMANHPITVPAEEILNKKGVIIVPDILANSGGVLGSYYEWKENVEGEKMEYEQAKEALIKQMKKATAEVRRIAKVENINLREAAYYIAVKRIARAIK